MVLMVRHDPPQVEGKVLSLTSSGQLEVAFVDACDRFDNERLPAGALPSIGGWLTCGWSFTWSAASVGAGMFRPRRAQFVEENSATPGRLIKEHRRPAHWAAGVGIDVAVVGIGK